MGGHEAAKAALL